MYGPWAEESVQPIIAIYVLWLVWFLAWIGASLGANRSGKRLPVLQEFFFRILAILGTLLLFSFTPWPGLDVQYQLWRPLAATSGWSLVGLTFVGFAFAAWGRAQLGWSSDPGHKEQLRVVATGPYRIVRQPIYLGVIVAAFATALIFGKPSSIGGAALLTLAFLVKTFMEESLMRSELGAYDDYAERVPMIVPFNTRWFRSERDVMGKVLASPRPVGQSIRPRLQEQPAGLGAPAPVTGSPTVSSETTPVKKEIAEPAPAAPVVASGPLAVSPTTAKEELPEPAPVADEPASSAPESGIVVSTPAPAEEKLKPQLDLFATLPTPPRVDSEPSSDASPDHVESEAEDQAEEEPAQPEASEAMSITNR
jgi:protein-S-isoprenylcysteine O-methyltransferase Ste14